MHVSLRLWCSACARAEFQAVQFMPLVITPQVLLRGLFVARDQMAGWLEAIRNVLPMSTRSRHCGSAVALALPFGAADLRRRTP